MDETGAKKYEVMATSSSQELFRLADFWTSQRQYNDVISDILHYKMALTEGDLTLREVREMFRFDFGYF